MISLWDFRSEFEYFYFKWQAIALVLNVFKNDKNRIKLIVHVQL